MIGGIISQVQYLTVGIRRGEAGHPLGMERSGGERRRLDRWDILEEATEVVSVTATTTATASESTTMMEG